MNRLDQQKVEPARKVDVTGTKCPMTFLNTKMAIDQLRDGELLEITLDSGEAMQSVPRNLKQEGHRIEHVSREGDTYRLLVRKRIQ